MIHYMSAAMTRGPIKLSYLNCRALRVPLAAHLTDRKCSKETTAVTYAAFCVSHVAPCSKKLARGRDWVTVHYGYSDTEPLGRRQGSPRRLSSSSSLGPPSVVRSRQQLFWLQVHLSEETVDQKILQNVFSVKNVSLSPRSDGCTGVTIILALCPATHTQVEARISNDLPV